VNQIDQTPPERRRVLIVLTAEDARLSRTDPGTVDALDSPEALLVALPERHEPGPPDKLLERLRQSNRLRPGALLVQSPFNVDHYEPADRALAEFAVEKFMLLSRLCSILGATRVTTEHVTSDRRKTTTRGAGTAKVRVQNAQAKVDHELVEWVTSRLQLNDNFRGGVPNISEAQAFLRERGLEDDEELASLVDLRAGENPLTSRQISLSLTRDSSENLRIAAQFTTMKFLKVDAEFLRQVEDHLDVTIEATIKF